MPVAVVSDQLQSTPDGGIDVAVGQASGAKRELERLEQHGPDARRAPGARVQPHQLRVGPKAAAGAVYGCELALDGRACDACRRTVGYAQHDRGPERPPADRRRTRPIDHAASHHDPPETTGGEASCAGSAACGEDSCDWCDSLAEGASGAACDSCAGASAGAPEDSPEEPEDS